MAKSSKKTIKLTTQESGILKPFSFTTDEGMGLPEFQYLCDKLRFIPTDGHVLLGGSPMLLANFSL